MQKVRLVEGTRGFLALWVLVGHVLAAAGLGANWRGPFKLIPQGGLAVDVFIIISGFVIFYLLDTARETYRRFLWRRFLRLYPVYFLCLVLSLFLLGVQMEVYSNAPWPSPLNASRIQIARDTYDHLFANLAVHLTMAHALVPSALLPSSNYAILGQAWSLSLEWQFYVLAPAIFAALTAGGHRAWVVIMIAVGAHFLLPGPEGFLPRHIPYFALGVASYFVWRQPLRPMWPLLVPVGVALAYFTTHDPPTVIWSAVFLGSLCERAPEARVLRAVLENGPALWLGRISYSVYLVHGMVLTLAMLFLEWTGSFSNQWAFFCALLGLTLVGTLLISDGLYRLVEAPFISLGKRQAIKPIDSARIPAGVV